MEEKEGKKGGEDKVFLEFGENTPNGFVSRVHLNVKREEIKDAVKEYKMFLGFELEKPKKTTD